MLDPTRAERARFLRALFFSPLIEAVGVIGVIVVAAVLPPPFVEPPNNHQYQIVNLVMPPLPIQQPPVAPPKPARPRVRPQPALVAPPIVAPKPRVPKIEVRHEIRPPVLRRPVVMPKPEIAEVTRPALPPRPIRQMRVHLGALGTGSSAKPTAHLPINKVQTGGFGDPNGIPGRALGGSKGNVARLGSFDLPIGPGYGNGSGGAHGARGVVASAGFGNGIAIPPGSGYRPRAGRGPVQSSGFGDAVAGAPAAAAHLPPSAPKFEPVVILSKPDPVYPEEARRLRIEGDVLLDVVFQANGRVSVQRVVRGLGHGMDEAAMQAAERIVFKPAKREGHPVDSQATVHIIFQLAY